MERAGILAFLIITLCTSFGKGKGNVDLISSIENKLEIQLGEYGKSLSSWLEKFNDKHIGNSELGRFLQYDEIKPKFVELAANQQRGIKKLGSSLIPLIFHVGATSTWMILTTLLAAKSVAIGLALLVFKIAVSSAKVASFFTALKGQKHDDGHSWAPIHGHYRSFGQDYSAFLPHSYHDDSSYDNSYVPEWTPSDSSQYSTISRDSGPYRHSDKNGVK